MPNVVSAQLRPTPGRARRDRASGLVVALLVLAIFPSAASAQYLDPTPPWPQLLPPAPTGDPRQPGAVPGCERPSPTCLERVIRELRTRRDRLGCDHRAVFATTYLIVTETTLDALRRDPDFFDDPDWLILLDALFADYYFRVLDTWTAGWPVPEAWQIAFRTAAVGDANAAQDMLLGINAHVQRDQAFVIAELGTRRADGASRKPDHDRFNELLRRSYEPIVREIGRRYDPIVSTTNASWHPVDDVAGLELVAGWREDVWRNAEALVSAATPQQRALVAERIERNSAAWARAVAEQPQQPGYREFRDAYCRAQAQRARGADGGAAAEPGRLRVSASRGCLGRVVRASVEARGVRRVVYSVDGTRVKVVRRPDRHGRWRLATSARRLRPGRHRLDARIEFADGSTRTVTRRVRVCADRAGRPPSYTG